MTLIRGLHNLKDADRGCALAVGNFDGVHLGHQAMIARARLSADQHRVPVTVLTFEPHPREFFRPDVPLARISTFRSKYEALRAHGADRVVLVRFCEHFAGLSPEDFVRELIVRQLGACAVVVGDDFRFGRGRGGDLRLLCDMGRQLGFEAATCPTVMMDNRRVSSTAVRSALADARLDDVSTLIGRTYTISGRVRHGRKLGQRLGFPTANIGMKRRMALRHGVYAVSTYDEAGTRWQGIANFGVRPTVDGSRQQLETHLFDVDVSLYGRLIHVEPLAFLRPERKFLSVEELSAQVHSDIKDARAWHSRQR